MTIPADSGSRPLEPREPQVDPHHSKRRATSMFEPAIMQARGRRLLHQARPAHQGPQPGDVRRRDRQRRHDAARAIRDDPTAFRRARRRLAVVHGAVRQLRRGRGRGPGQGAGRHAAQDPVGDGGQRPRRPTDRSRRRRRPSCRSATCASWRPGELIPGDGDVIEGIASVDESAITGESAPVIRESGGDRCAVTGGTRVLSDQIVVQDHDRSRARASSTG